MGANAQTSVPLFVANSVLTAAQQNISAATGIPVFATTVTRDAAFGGSNKVLAEGQLCYLESTNVVQYYDGAAWATVGPATAKIAQVLSTAKTDTFTTTSATFTDVTGMSVTITPSLATSQILVIVSGNVGSNTATNSSFFAILRTSTLVGIGDTASNRARVGTQAQPSADARMASFGLTFLDSPATTSATTYKLQMRVDLAGTGYFNRSYSDADVSSTGRGASTITVMEILA